MSLYFMNNGELNPVAMLTFGVSSKKKNDSIGKFGTGFKYAIAIIHRLGGTIEIESCGKKYSFSVVKETINDKEFDVIYMNGNPAGFTTHLGHNWEPWQAFRELYCNALDEDGITSNEIDTSYETIIKVDCKELETSFINKDKYFLTSKPLEVSGKLEVHPLNGYGFIYYQGIAVGQANNKCEYTYNITSGVELTEDRTVKHEWWINDDIADGLQNLKNTKLIRKIIGKDCWEAVNGFKPTYACSEEFLKVCLEEHKVGGIHENVRLFLEKKMPQNVSWEEVTLSKLEQSMLDKASTFLGVIGFSKDDFNIHVVKNLGQNVLGRAYENEIFLSQRVFDLGTKQVASALYEEWVHLTTGYADETRNLQTFLFDRIMSLVEEIKQEPM